MRRANINLFPVECNRASGEFNRVWQLVVSQLVNGEAETTPVCSGCPALSLLRFRSWCTDLCASPRLSSYRTRFLLTPFVLRLSLSYAYVIHRLHAGVDPARFNAVATVYLLLLDPRKTLQ